MNKSVFSDLISHLECSNCGKQYTPDEIEYVCPDHPDNNRVEVIYDYEKIKKAWSKEHLQNNSDKTIKRYSPLLPIQPAALDGVPYYVGDTPLIKAKNIESELGFDNVFIKYDSANPSCSLKDRASFIVTALAKAKGKDVVAAASSGNAACSLAAVCAAANMQAVLFVPKSIPLTKLIQIAIYGATVFVVEGTYNQAFDLCAQACEEFGWFSRNTGFNPYTREGKKTVALEISEQLNWNAPDWIFVPVGDGCILSGVEKGFRDLKNLGWIEKIPRIVAIQAEDAPSLYHAWSNDLSYPEYIEATSEVDSINVGHPGDGVLALKALKNSNGLCITMSDNEMRQAMVDMAETEGVLGCTAGSAPYGALRRFHAEGLVKPDETVVLLNTGHGLKDIHHHSRDGFEKIISVEPDIDSLKALVDKGI